MSKAPVINQHEWDFLTCPEPQRRFCCYYEYLRSLEPVRDLFAKHGTFARRKVLKKGIFINDEFAALINLPPEEQKVGFGPSKNVFKPLLVILTDIAEFPNKPWLQISDKARLEIVSEYHRFTRVTIGLSADDLLSIAQSRRSYSDVWPDIVAALRIPLGMTTKEIIDSFSFELEEYAAKHPEHFRKSKGGRGLYLDRLRQLGAWRLAKVMNPQDALSHSKKQSGAALYAGKEEFQDAVTAAEAFRSALLAGF